MPRHIGKLVFSGLAHHQKHNIFISKFKAQKDY
jgi:hypothetical protein